MAEERDDTEHTEDPTPRRLEEAIKRGDVVKSVEVSTWFTIGGGTLVLMVFAAPMAANLEATLRGVLAHSSEIPVDGPALDILVKMLLTCVFAALGIPVLLLALAALMGNAIQHRILFSFDPVTPQLSRISPAAGLRRMFSKQALANFAKGLAKLMVFGAVIGALLWPQRLRIVGLVGLDPVMILPFTRVAGDENAGHGRGDPRHCRGGRLLVPVSAMVRPAKNVGAGDEGGVPPEPKAIPRSKARSGRCAQARARKRMMAAVPKASVVITNPTHFAVALQYERGMTAPVCVAKGADLIARKIREVAEAHGIPVIENPPLARALHGTVEIDQEIPQEHYRAVAEIIGYVMRLRRSVLRPG